MEIQHFSDKHPLIFEERSHENDDKKCAEAPLHRNHNSKLLSSPPSDEVKIVEENLGEVDDIADIVPISIESPIIELKNSKWYGRFEALLDSPSAYFFSLYCRLFLHKKCEINHSFHPHHPLILQFNGKRLPCKICQEVPISGLVCSTCNFTLHIECPKIPTEIKHPCHPKHPFILQFNYENLRCQSCQIHHNGFVYCCSICKLAFHIGCISPPTVIEDKERHDHPFTLCWRELPFICAACGISGNCISYICLMCGFRVHKNCISLPSVINLPRHQHLINHTYFLEEDNFRKRTCGVCSFEVNIRHGSYFCSSCNYIFHVNCVLKERGWYLNGGEGKILTVDQSSFKIISVINGIAAEISHFSHQHNLVLMHDIEDGKLCDACILFISESAPYYRCSQCDFFLHKSCAELPRTKKLWFHQNQNPLTLTPDCIFKCGVCDCECSGFAYKFDGQHCANFCLRCALISSVEKSDGHEHLLYFYGNKEGQCNACGEISTPSVPVRYWCDNCSFALHDKCLKLPHIARHKCDEHPLKLTYHDDNDLDDEYHYCDICEEKRNLNHWFYHCAICDTSAHTKCVLKDYPFIKRGSRYKQGDHPHQPLIFVQKVYDYPKCHDHECCKPCLDLALECAKTGCKYIVHWECIKPSQL